MAPFFRRRPASGGQPQVFRSLIQVNFYPRQRRSNGIEHQRPNSPPHIGDAVRLPAPGQILLGVIGHRYFLSFFLKIFLPPAFSQDCLLSEGKCP